MIKVLIDRDLLERAAYSLELAYEADTPTVRGIAAVLAAPSGTPELPVKAYYYESTTPEGVRTRSVGLEVRKTFADAPLVLESDAMAGFACLEGDIAKRDARIVEIEGALLAEQEHVEVLADELAAIKAQETHSVEFQQFMTAVVTGAGLLSCGKQSKRLAAELSATAYKYLLVAPVSDSSQKPVGYRCWFNKEPDSIMVEWGSELPPRLNPSVTYQMIYAAPVSEAKAQGVVMPTVDQAMRVVLREMGSSKHIRGTSNWCADVGRSVLDEVARLNAVPVQQVSAPDGWRLVPVEPTPEMMAAAIRCYGNDDDCYRAMLAAAPAAPQPFATDDKGEPLGWIEQDKTNTALHTEAAPAADASHVFYGMDGNHP